MELTYRELASVPSRPEQKPTSGRNGFAHWRKNISFKNTAKWISEMMESFGWKALPHTRFSYSSTHRITMVGWQTFQSTRWFPQPGYALWIGWTASTKGHHRSRIYSGLYHIESKSIVILDEDLLGKRSSMENPRMELWCVLDRINRQVDELPLIVTNLTNHRVTRLEFEFLLSEEIMVKSQMAIVRILRLLDRKYRKKFGPNLWALLMANAFIARRTKHKRWMFSQLFDFYKKLIGASYVQSCGRHVQ